MAVFHIKKGKNIPLKGAAIKDVVKLPLPNQVAVQPLDFAGLKPRLVAKVNDAVKVGTPVLTDKTMEGLMIVSPVSGKISAINRGDKRVLFEIVIEADGQQNAEKFDAPGTSNLNRDKVVEHMLKGGLWPAVRQRPFHKIANPKDHPKSIFVHATSTEPLAPDYDFILEGQENEFQAGLDVLTALTEGAVHLCVQKGAKSKALTESKNVTIHQFAGPHPSGNVGTHIHYIDPINKGDVVWFVEAQDVIRIARLFTKGEFSPEQVVAVTGEGAKNNIYVKTILGAPLSTLLQGSDITGMRCLTGSVLSGRSVGAAGFLGFYDAQITVIPEGGKREFLGWLKPGINKYTFTKTYLSGFLPEKEVSLDTDENGSHRAIVLNHIYDQYNTLDIMTYFLLKAVISGDIEESEKLGILECSAEDFALATFACPSKVDVSGIIQKGLAVIEKEG